MNSIVLINPNLVMQRNDPFTTGIVYMPISLAYTAAVLVNAGYSAAVLVNAGYSINIIDAFAEAPKEGFRRGMFTVYGLTPGEVEKRIPDDVDAVLISAINLTSHISAIGIVQQVKNRYRDVPVIILENTQAVTAYALEKVMGEFFKVGADYVITGESEERVLKLLQLLQSNGTEDELKTIDGLGSPRFYSPVVQFIQDLDSLPMPAWDKFPLDQYWGLGFAHGPQSSSRYLPLLTSRGCPYPCRFCVIPATNQQRWRARSPVNVVDEMEYYVDKFGVEEFHLEDLDPTISDKRIRDISKEIIKRDLKIVWKIVAGTKVETIRDGDTVDLMAKAGCSYISISPETGSPRVLELMNKPFDLSHAVKIVRRMNENSIKSQACFVVGYPGEEEEDLRKTWDLVHCLTREGVDEIALFIITPVPGSAIFGELRGYRTLSEMNFTPTWREDYRMLNRFRLRLYIRFLWWKTIYHPLKILLQPFNFLRRRFETKMEMVPYRGLMLWKIDRRIDRTRAS
jgi:radical SAM superfamily enzyme YgiQ (UPF0313 family)